VGALTLVIVAELEVRQSRFGAPAAKHLVALAQDELTQRYGSGDANPIEAVQFDPPEGAFLIAWLDGKAVGCGGWRSLSDDGGEPTGMAEIKRMYVLPDRRGSGVATALMAAIEESAREHDMRQLVLETGLKQPEAICLYEKLGYSRIPNYGHYKDAPDCVSFGRAL